MGCFDVTCPITGLAIKENDPVRWTLVTPTKGTFEPTNPNCILTFIMPALAGKYDNYGSVDWASIKPNELWSFLWDGISPILKPGSCFLMDKSEELSKLEANELFSYTASGRLSSSIDGMKKDLSIWMVHKWAFDWISRTVSGRRIAEARNIAESVVKYINKDMGSLNFFPSILDDDFLFRFKCCKSGFSETVQHQYIDYLTDTILFFSGLFHVRRTIMPVTICGEQHESYEYLPDFTSLIAQKALEANDEAYRD